MALLKFGHDLEGEFRRSMYSQKKVGLHDLKPCIVSV